MNSAGLTLALVTSEATPRSVPIEIFALLLVLGVIIVIWDFFIRRSTQLRKSGGLSSDQEVVALKKTGGTPPETFLSKELGLSSRPDALVREANSTIPVIVKPTGRKVRDRHVVELLVHLRCIEESTGKRPPYGILILGRDGRRVEIRNTADKQQWLEELVHEMHAIIDGADAIPAPDRFKCKNCEVRRLCDFSAYREEGQKIQLSTQDIED